MDSAIGFSTWVEVNLDAIESNVRKLVEITRVPLMAVVKADAYGHGAAPVARAAQKGGATWCAIARIEEALELREAGLDCPLLLLGFTPPARIDQAILNRVSMTVWDFEQIKEIAAAAHRLGQSASLHLKVDTGMSRLGVRPEQAYQLAATLTSTQGIHFEGIFTHFARADEHSDRVTEEQEQLFRRLISDLEQAGLRPPLVHASNSAAAISRPSAIFDMVRTGIAIYGLHPSPTCLLPSGFKAALAWKTVLSQVKTLPPRRGVSYGHIYHTRAEERIGTLPVGYADGYRRTAGNQVLVGGRRVPVVGRVCMDQATVLLDNVPDAKPGDEVVLIGVQGEEHISAEDLALGWGTINYEVVCGIGRRVPRRYQ